MNQNFINAQSWAKNYLEYWEKTVAEWQKSILKYSEDFAGTYSSFIKKCTEGDFFTAYNDLCNDVFGKTFTFQGDKLTMDTYSRLTDIANLYTRLFKSFAEFTTTSPDNIPEHLNAFLGNWVEIQKDLFLKMFGVSLPSVFVQEGDAAKFIGTAFTTYRNMFNDTIKYLPETIQPVVKDYIRVLESSGTAIEGIKDPKKFGELRESWRKAFDSSLDQFTQAVSNGNTEKFSKSLKKDVDSFLRYITSTAEVFSNLYKPGLEAIEETGKKAGEILKDTSPESVKNFYNFLIKDLESEFFDFFKSKDFSNALKANFDTFIEFRTTHFEMLESMLHMNPLIAQTETGGTKTAEKSGKGVQTQQPRKPGK